MQEEGAAAAQWCGARGLRTGRLRDGEGGDEREGGEREVGNETHECTWTGESIEGSS
jgi:hypothetical protein